MFARRGYAGACVKEVAQEAGVAKPTVYNHLHDKENLFRQAMQTAADTVADECVAVLDRLRAPGDDLGQVAEFPDLVVDVHGRTAVRIADALADRLARVALAGRLRVADPARAAFACASEVCPAGPTCPCAGTFVGAQFPAPLGLSGWVYLSLCGYVRGCAVPRAPGSVRLGVLVPVRVRSWVRSSPRPWVCPAGCTCPCAGTFVGAQFPAPLGCAPCGSRSGAGGPWLLAQFLAPLGFPTWAYLFPCGYVRGCAVPRAPGSVRLGVLVPVRVRPWVRSSPRPWVVPPRGRSSGAGRPRFCAVPRAPSGAPQPLAVAFRHPPPAVARLREGVGGNLCPQTPMLFSRTT
ncbi:TetR/AcrR family transcriptional regulator [Streptomyces uncialis]|uniref:TetR/AcrR family transcriptional regulator n=1 Tax=Streptomyces uncialis TaxID=1048205 RepID=UPI0038699A06